MKPWRWKNVLAGRCVTCGDELSQKSKNFCEYHRLRRNAYYRAKHRTDPPERVQRRKEKNRQWRAARALAFRKAQNYTCSWCGKPIDPVREPRRRTWHKACKVHNGEFKWIDQQYAPWYRERHLRAAKAYQSRNRAAGLCVTCGRPAEKGYVNCTIHRVRRKAELHA